MQKKTQRYMDQHGLRAADMSERIGASVPEFEAWLKGKGELSAADRERLSGLLKQTDQTQALLEERDHLLVEAKRRGISQRQIAEECGTTEAAFSAMLRRRTTTSHLFVKSLAWLQKRLDTPHLSYDVSFPASQPEPKRPSVEIQFEQCPICKHLTTMPPAAAVCQWCGTRLATQCEECQTYSDDHYCYCPYCGHKKEKAQ